MRLNEKIDDLRWLLEVPGRGKVSLTMLCGLRDVTELGDSYVRVEDSGDRAFVFLGPKEKLNGERREQGDGTIVYTFTLKPG